MRIHIAGGAGSGKTTLAREFGERLRIPVIGLDIGGYWADRGVMDGVRADLIRQANELPDWVSEGAFVEWALPFFELADTIVFLEIRPWIAYKRIVVRHIKASARRNNPHKGLRLLWSFLGSTRGWYRSTTTVDDHYGYPPQTTGVTTLQDTRRVIDSFASKVVTCGNAAQARVLLTGYTHGHDDPDL